MTLSVIIPVLGDTRIRECLEGLFASDPAPASLEVLVVDNGPSEEIRAVVSRFPAQYIVEPRRGSYAARNRGIERAGGDILVFTDADCVPPPTWLREIRSAFEDRSCRLAVGPSSGLGEGPVARWVQSIDDSRWSALAQSSVVDYCDTRNFAGRREIFAEERFDPEFLNAGDVEVGLRMTRRGEAVRFLPRMGTAHWNPSTLRSVLRRGIRRGRGIEAVHRKHGVDAPISGARPLVLFGRNIKPTVLRALSRSPLREAGLAALSVLLMGLIVVLSILAQFKAGERLGPKVFRTMDRASILFGRLLETRARRPIGGGPGEPQREPATRAPTQA